MPIQNTKFTIGQPQKTGLLLPSTPTPVMIMYPAPANSNPVAATDRANAAYHALGGWGRSAMPQTVSVTDTGSALPSTSGARRVGSAVVLSSSGMDAIL
jgi:hypothetical protein